MDFKNYIRDVKNFPKEGVLFKDITPLLKDSKAFKKATEELLKSLGDIKVDKVVGVESRGFFFSPLLAVALNAGFVPVRKPGKLPFTTHKEVYSLEYAKDILEIHVDGIEKGERVLIHDDVLATGGTAAAVCNLIERMGGVIVQCNFLIELDFLKGRDKLHGVKVNALMHY